MVDRLVELDQLGFLGRRRRNPTVAAEDAELRREYRDLAWLDTLPERHEVGQLLAAIEDHELAEEGAIEAYHRLATTSGDPVIALLMQLVVDDEERHHRLLKHIATSLYEFVGWQQAAPAGPASASADRRAQREALEATRALIKDERDGARQLRGLAKPAARRGQKLTALLLEVMARDSEKHEQILRYVAERLEEPGQERSGQG